MSDAVRSYSLISYIVFAVIIPLKYSEITSRRFSSDSSEMQHDFAFSGMSLLTFSKPELLVMLLFSG